MSVEFRCNLFFSVFNRQGKLGLQKRYTSQTETTMKKIIQEITTAAVLSRQPKTSSFLEWKNLKTVYKRFVISSYSKFSPTRFQSIPDAISKKEFFRFFYVEKRLGVSSMIVE